MHHVVIASRARAIRRCRIFVHDTRQLISVAGKTQGNVVAFERRLAKGGSADYPVIEFATASGHLHRFTTSGAPDYAKGEIVDVIYDASDPAKARLDVFTELWLGSSILAAAGIGTLFCELRRKAKASTH
ncbi:MAG: hypothetical protein BWY57_01235 [Betaproteobacteria bacterium ADurb.Bin341]|nr:MAG: hypothetical protein BWY57_01235 [Betaproteobacteria bacterium ADurb.Bin341]